MVKLVWQKRILLRQTLGAWGGHSYLGSLARRYIQIKTIKKFQKRAKRAENGLEMRGGGYCFSKKRYDKMEAIREDTSTESVLKKEKAPSLYGKRAR